MQEPEEFKIIDSFPDYEITSWGNVFNVKTGREMTLSPTLQGDLTVGMVKGGHQYRRSVKVLVAKAFVEGEDGIFNTPIQLDGDKRNLHASNIQWRPRWFAWEYGRQFANTPDYAYNGPIADVTNEIEYFTIWEAAVYNGILCKDILDSLNNGVRVFPRGERYIYI